MYKVLIVDDEKMIRMGMKKVLPWQELKIEEVYTAASGKEALEILEENQVPPTNRTAPAGLDPLRAPASPV